MTQDEINLLLDSLKTIALSSMVISGLLGFIVGILIAKS